MGVWVARPEADSVHAAGAAGRPLGGATLAAQQSPHRDRRRRPVVHAWGRARAQFAAADDQLGDGDSVRGSMTVSVRVGGRFHVGASPGWASCRWRCLAVGVVFLPAFVIGLLGAVDPLVASHLNSGDDHSSRVEHHLPLRRRQSSTVRVFLPVHTAYSEARIAPLNVGGRSFARRPAMAVRDGSQGHLCDSRRALRRRGRDPSPGAERSERAHPLGDRARSRFVARAIEVTYIHKLRPAIRPIGYDRRPRW